MSRRFQFSLKQVLGSVTLFGISLQLFRLASTAREPISISGIVAGLAFLYAAWGILAGRDVETAVQIGVVMSLFFFMITFYG